MTRREQRIARTGEMRRAGTTKAEIARELGVGWPTVGRYLKALGLD